MTYVYQWLFIYILLGSSDICPINLVITLNNYATVCQVMLVTFFLRTIIHLNYRLDFVLQIAFFTSFLIWLL